MIKARERKSEGRRLRYCSTLGLLSAVVCLFAVASIFLWFRLAQNVTVVKQSKELRNADNRVDRWITQAYVQSAADARRSAKCSYARNETKGVISVPVSVVVGGTSTRYWQEALAVLTSVMLHTPLHGASGGVLLGEPEPPATPRYPVRLIIRIITDSGGVVGPGASLLAAVQAAGAYLGWGAPSEGRLAVRVEVADPWLRPPGGTTGGLRHALDNARLGMPPDLPPGGSAWLRTLWGLPNAHYSGRFAELKLHIPLLPPADSEGEPGLELVLDTDSVMLPGQRGALGLLQHVAAARGAGERRACVWAAPEQSRFYLSDDPAGAAGGTYRWPFPPPAGLNSGVLVYDRQTCACEGAARGACQPAWEAMAAAVEAVRARHPSWELQLGDQDVLNAAVAGRPQLLGALPCEANLQDAGMQGGALRCVHSRRGGSGALRRPAVLHHNFLAKRHGLFRGHGEALAEAAVLWMHAGAPLACRDGAPLAEGPWAGGEDPQSLLTEWLAEALPIEVKRHMGQ